MELIRPREKNLHECRVELNKLRAANIASEAEHLQLKQELHKPVDATLLQARQRNKETEIKLLEARRQLGSQEGKVVELCWTVARMIHAVDNNVSQLYPPH